MNFQFGKVRSFGMQALSACTFALISLLLVFPTYAQSTLFQPSAVYLKDGEGRIERAIYTEIGKAKTATGRIRRSAETVVLLNGLIYDINRWNPTAEALVQGGVHVIRLSFTAQPESLRLLEKGASPEFLKEGLTLETMADDVERVLKHHRVQGPVTVVGLSYGGTVATTFAKLYPKRVKDLVLLSPLVIPLDNYDPSGKMLRQYLDTVRFWENAPCLTYGWFNPWLCTSTDYWYDTFYNYFYESYLDRRIASAPQDLDAGLFKKSVFHLVRATRDYDLRKEVANLKNTHFVISEKEEANLKRDQLKAWSMIPQKQRRSLAEFKGVVHALPDEAPARTADWIFAIANGDESLQAGDEYVVE
jgi:pimeloyl-ACP methyl ester carboxylesterase